MKIVDYEHVVEVVVLGENFRLMYDDGSYFIDEYNIYDGKWRHYSSLKYFKKSYFINRVWFEILDTFFYD